MTATGTRAPWKAILAGAVLALAGLAYVALRSIPSPPKGQRDLRDCANNLSQLWKLQLITTSSTSATRRLPIETGGRFWLVLTKTTPGIDASNAGVLVCPASGISPGLEVTSYRGPRIDVNTPGFGEIVGCCGPGFHPDGAINVLKRDGVVTVSPGEPLYDQAMKATVP